LDFHLTDERIDFTFFNTMRVADQCFFENFFKQPKERALADSLVRKHFFGVFLILRRAQQLASNATNELQILELPKFFLHFISVQ
jgi:hypothetical protein